MSIQQEFHIMEQQIKDNLMDIIYSDNSTTNNRRLAEYILTNCNSVAFMTAAEIAENAGVSQSTVTRFVTIFLGFQNFALFIKTIQCIVRNQINGVDIYPIPTSKKGSSFENFINQEIENLRKIQNEVTDEKLRRVALQISNYDTIFVIGYRAGSHVANYFHFFLSKVHPDVRLYTHGGSGVYDILHKLDRANSLVVNFVFPRYPREIIDVIEYLKKEKFNFITISDCYALEIWGITECSLVTPVSFTTLFESYATTYTVLNHLIDTIGKIDLKRTKEMLTVSERFYQDMKIHYRKE